MRPAHGTACDKLTAPLEIGEAYYNFHYDRSKNRTQPLLLIAVSLIGSKIRAVSSIGRAFGLHPKGHRFEPYTAHFHDWRGF